MKPLSEPDSANLTQHRQSQDKKLMPARAISATKTEGIDHENENIFASTHQEKQLDSEIFSTVNNSKRNTHNLFTKSKV